MSKADQHGEALLGISLAETGRTAKGSPPSDEELALLMEGGLGHQRRAEVLSHLAVRPERYRQWQDLLEMASQPAADSSLLAILSRGLNNWLIDWRYALGSLAVVGATLFVFQATQPPQQAEPMAVMSGADEVAPSPTAEFAAPPAPAAPADSAAARRQMAESAKQEQQEVRAASKSVTAMARVCTPLSHPVSAEAGALCSVALSAGTSDLIWRGGDEGGAHPLGSIHEKVLQLRVSPEQNWLAVQTAQAIYVQRVADLFADNSQRSQLPFNAGTATLRWQGEVLVISVLQALGDSDDDLKYRYDPASGELEPKP